MPGPSYLYKAVASIAPELNTALEILTIPYASRSGDSLRQYQQLCIHRLPNDIFNQNPNGSMPSWIPSLAVVKWGILRAQFTCPIDSVTDHVRNFRLNERENGKVVQDNYQNITNIRLESKMKLENKEAGDGDEPIIFEESRRVVAAKDDCENVFSKRHVTCELGDEKETWVLYSPKVSKGKEPMFDGA